MSKAKTKRGNPKARRAKCAHARTGRIDFWDAIREVHVQQLRCRDCGQTASLGPAAAVPRRRSPVRVTPTRIPGRVPYAEDQLELSVVAAVPITVSIDSDENGVAVQINGIDTQDVAPMFYPDEADALADDLRAGADAARQAARDGYSGPAVTVELVIGDEPEQGVELELVPLPCGSHDRADCPCDHPPGEVGPCGGCNCADPIDDDATSPPIATFGPESAASLAEPAQDSAAPGAQAPERSDVQAAAIRGLYGLDRTFDGEPPR